MEEQSPKHLEFHPARFAHQPLNLRATGSNANVLGASPMLEACTLGVASCRLACAAARRRPGAKN